MDAMNNYYKAWAKQVDQLQWEAGNHYLWTCNLCGGGHLNGYCELSYHVPKEQATYMGNPPRFQNDPYFNIYNMEGRNYPNYQPEGISSLEATFKEFNQVCEQVSQVCERIMFKSRMP